MISRRGKRLTAAMVISVLLVAWAQVAIADEEPYSGTEVTGTVVTTTVVTTTVLTTRPGTTAPPTVLGQTQENLPATGADTTPWLLAGLGFLVAGSLILIAARSRRVGDRRG